MEEIYQPSVQRYLQVKSILFNYMGRRLRFEILYNFKEEELEQQKNIWIKIGTDPLGR